MKIWITGSGTLAATVRECCAKHFTISDQPAVLWICEDTPLLPDGGPNTEAIRWHICKAIIDLGVDTRPGTLILISSQVPVGTTARLEREWPECTFAYSPENIRAATAVEDFMNQERVIAGIRTKEYDDLLRKLFTPFTKHIHFMSPESAEMIKHAINTWLGMQIAFANEIARICLAVVADVESVSVGLRSDRRVGPHAPLKPGKPFGGGHLDRDLIVLTEIAKQHGIQIPIIENVRQSNLIAGMREC
jgi:UDPglucose 6-dehydrogenase